MAIELVAIREAARRLGVSDTAVRKAIDKGRINAPLDEDKDPSNGRPRLRWPDCETQWMANSDMSKRTHAGSQGSPKRALDHAQPSKVTEVRVSVPKGEELDGEGEVTIHDGMTLTEAKTAKAIYDARKARMEYEESQGVLVRIEEVRTKIFKMTREARDQLVTMEDRLSPILASLTELNDVRRVLRDEVRLVCERIAAASEKL